MRSHATIPHMLSPKLFAALLFFVLPTYAQDRQLVQQSATVEKRVALVIGNSSYTTAPLKNPVNDAQDMTAALRASGFDVIHKENLDQNNMKRAIREFGMKIRDGGTALFYYAGHGLQVKGVNYLVPVDAQIQSEEEVEYEMVDAGFVLAQMDSARTRLNIVILDACRNNPFARSFRSATNGLAEMDAPDGTLIAYATSPGSIASDGATGRNGLYTRELLKVIGVPNLTIEEVFKRVRISVHGITQGKQTPWEASSLMSDFYFQRTASNAQNSAPSSQPSMDQPQTTSGDNTSKQVLDPVLFPSDAREDLEHIYSQREVDQKALITSQPRAQYTDSGRQNNVQGTVRLQVVLTRAGSVGKITIVRGGELGHGLPERAIAAARQIKFTPAMKNGQPVSVQVLLDYAFSVY